MGPPATLRRASETELLPRICAALSLALLLEAPSHNCLTPANRHPQNGTAHLKSPYCTFDNGGDRVYRGQSVAVATVPESRLRRIRNVKDRPVIGDRKHGRRARDLLRPGSARLRMTLDLPFSDCRASPFRGSVSPGITTG